MRAFSKKGKKPNLASVIPKEHPDFRNQATSRAFGLKKIYTGGRLR